MWYVLLVVVQICSLNWVSGLCVYSYYLMQAPIVLGEHEKLFPCMHNLILGCIEVFARNKVVFVTNGPGCSCSWFAQLWLFWHLFHWASSFSSILFSLKRCHIFVALPIRLQDHILLPVAACNRTVFQCLNEFLLIINTKIIPCLQGITTYEYVVAMRAQNEPPIFGEEEDSILSSPSVSTATGMSVSSSLGLHYRGGAGWCTPPRIFVEHQV